MRATPLHGLILDLALICAATALALGHVIPGEAAFGFISLVSGAKIGRAVLRGGDGDSGDAGGTSSPALPPGSTSSSSSSSTSRRIGEVSIAAAIDLALLALFVPHSRGA